MAEFLVKYAGVILFYYIAAIILSAGITFFDKKRAKSGGERVSENKLIAIAVFGNALSMYTTMRTIKHKTRKRKFMYGLPVIILVKVVLVAVIFIIAKLSIQ